MSVDVSANLVDIKADVLLIVLKRRAGRVAVSRSVVVRRLREGRSLREVYEEFRPAPRHPVLPVHGHPANMPRRLIQMLVALLRHVLGLRP